MYRPANSALEALQGDWEKVGKDLQKAINEAENTLINA